MFISDMAFTFLARYDSEVLDARSRADGEIALVLLWLRASQQHCARSAMPVAGKLGLAHAIGIEESNGGVKGQPGAGASAAGAIDQHPSVGADAGIAIADGDGEFLRSVSGTSAAIVIRKSFFAPCSLMKGIFIRSAVDFDHRATLYRNALSEFVARPAQPRSIQHGLRGVAAFHQGPVRVEEQIGARQCGVQVQIIVACQRVAERNVQGAVDRCQLAEAR